MCRLAKTLFMFLLFSLSLLSWTHESANDDHHASHIAPAAIEQTVLLRILEKTADYCKKLEEVSIYYFCNERIRETIYPVPRKYRGPMIDKLGIHGQFSRFHNKPSIINEFLYEYQIISKGNKEKERRILLEENGKDKNKKNARLKTQCFKYTAAVLYPLVFKESEQRYYRFEISGKEKWKDRNVFVIKAFPRPGIQKDLIWGKFWVDETNFSILKIEMSPKSIGNYHKIKNRAMALNSKPRLTLLIDYTIEKNNIRFPGRFFIEEAYITPRSSKILLAEIMVNYNEYRFFSVGVDVEYKDER